MAIAPLPVQAALEVIPPGNEAVVREMLGAGENLPGDCKLAEGSIERSLVLARYECSGGLTVRVELRHPSEGAGAATRTQRFAIIARDAAPPPLIDAIRSNVAAAEGRFQWMAPPSPPAPTTTPSAQPPPSPLVFGGVSGPLAVAFFIAVLAAPLAVVAGVLTFYIAALCAPPRRGEAFWAPPRRRLACYLALFLAIVAFGAFQVVPHWSMQVDEERDFILSALCASGKGCPIVGNDMNQLRVKLGPLNRYLMTLCQLVTPDPRLALVSILALHALGAAWLAATTDLLVGFPFGLLAGLFFGANSLVLHEIAAASNGAWGSVFLAGAVAGTVRWMRGEPRAFVLAVACLAAASQLHGTNLALVPPLVLVAAWWRPPVPASVLALGAMIVGALYSPWLVYQWQTGWNDFSLISTSWMVSHGPGLPQRLGRLVSTLGGSAAALLTVVGAAGLISGRALPLSERPVGRTVLLLLALPLGATLLAGGNWAGRYAVPAVAPGAMVAAAGAKMLAPLLSAKQPGARRARFAAGALGLVWLAGVLLEGSSSAFGRGDVRLGLAEQIEAIRSLGEHGFGTADLETRVHGAAWNRWSGGQIYLGKWLIGTEAQALDGEHAVFVECEAIRPGFASWQHILAAASRRMPHLLAGYRAELAPAVVEFVGPGGVLWTKEDALPFYGQMTDGGDARMRALFDPKLVYPTEFAELRDLWSSNPPAGMRLATTLAPGRDDRTIVLVHDAALSARVTMAGVAARSLEPAVFVDDIAQERFLVDASDRAMAVTIEAQIDLPAEVPVPRRVDLYEEPPCERE